jgi:hypothetical protein
LVDGVPRDPPSAFAKNDAGRAQNYLAGKESRKMMPTRRVIIWTVCSTVAFAQGALYARVAPPSGEVPIETSICTWVVFLLAEFVCARPSTEFSELFHKRSSRIFVLTCAALWASGAGAPPRLAASEIANPSIADAVVNPIIWGQLRIVAIIAVTSWAVLGIGNRLPKNRAVNS